MKNLNFISCTQAAAIATYEWIGKGDKLNADKAATDAMRKELNNIDFAGIIAQGEGIKDNSHGIFLNERVGLLSESNELYEISCDPIEGTTPTVTAGPEAISTLAIANNKCFFKTDCFYMLKMAYGPKIAKKVKLNISSNLLENINIISEVLKKPKEEVVVCMLDRPRHQNYIDLLRKENVKIKLIKDCDVTGAILTCLKNDIDLLYGIGGAPETVISAAAIKCLGGDIQGICVNEQWQQISETINLETLVYGDCVFVATGITNGSLVKGVIKKKNFYITHSIIMKYSQQEKTIEKITKKHNK
jgi:fructose-1,6-bisphosphatase/sedoheptulose 1,7-bisphosphatase-like protein